uniref:Protein inhibitor of activated STAT, 1b n=1 Tax=Salarias fasciatus TaxID=181472 RepID=A0A672FK04_SALFA
MFYQQMVMSLRVSELQVLLGYAGRNKHGRKHELLTKALHLLKAGCSPAVQMKIKELYRRRFPSKMVSPVDLAIPGVHSASSLPAGLAQLGFDSHSSPSSLLPVSLLGPKHELSLPHLPSSLHPLHPDVKLQRLPFYDVLDELIKPTSLASDNSQRFQEACYAFALTPQQVQQISSSMDISGTKCDFAVQVQLRFCLSETSCPQEDHFPPNLCVKVNGKPCNLPGYLPPTKNGVEPKRPSRPINITSLVRLSTTVPNTIVVSWTSEIGRSFSMAVYLVRQQSSAVLLQRLRAKGIRNPDHSRALIKEKLTADPESEIATTSLRVSLLCPLGKMRLTIPCRSMTCSHLQCFDATLYIQMNEKKPTWVCPVCDKKAPYEHLIIDGLFMEILNSCSDCDEIQFKEDGSWAPMRSKKEVQEVSASYNGVDNLSRSDSHEHKRSSHDNNKKVDVIDLTLDSSSEDELDDEPPPKRPCPSLSPVSPPPSKGDPLSLKLHTPHAFPLSRSVLDLILSELGTSTELTGTCHFFFLLNRSSTVSTGMVEVLRKDLDLLFVSCVCFYTNLVNNTDTFSMLELRSVTQSHASSFTDLNFFSFLQGDNQVHLHSRLLFCFYIQIGPISWLLLHLQESLLGLAQFTEGPNH